MIEINCVEGYLKLAKFHPSSTTFVLWADKALQASLMKGALMRTWAQLSNGMPGLPGATTQFGPLLEISIEQVPLNVAVNCHADGPHDRLLVFQMDQPSHVLEQGYARGKGAVSAWHMRIMTMLMLNHDLFRSAGVKSSRVMFPKASERIDIAKGWVENLRLPDPADDEQARQPDLGVKQNRGLTNRILLQVPVEQVDLYKRQRATVLRFIYGSVTYLVEE